MADLTVGLVTGLIIGTLRRLGVIDASGAPASGGPTYNSTTDILGGTPDFVGSVIVGSSATAADNVRITRDGTNNLGFYKGDGTAGAVVLTGSDQIQLRGATSGTGGKLAAIYGGTGTAGSAGGTAGLYGGGSGTSTGGACEVVGGTPSVDGVGGGVLLQGGDSTGTDKAGADITIRPGARTGTGAPGTAKLDGRFALDKGADVASANTLTLGADGNFFKITGTTTINGIVTLGWQAGSVIHLMFTGALTVTHASGAPGTGAVALLLNAASNMTTAANNTLTLVYDGTNWVELARKV